MAVVIGFIPDEYGEAALAHGLDEAKRRDTGVVVVNRRRATPWSIVATSARTAR